MPEIGAAGRAIRAYQRKVEAGIFGPNVGASRLLPIDLPVMAEADAPTFVNTVTDSSTIMTGTTKFAAHLTDARLRILGGPLATVAPGGTFTYYRASLGNAGMIWGFEFETDAPEFELPIFGAGELNVLVDGAWALAEPLVFTNTSGQRGLVTVTFGDGTQTYAQPRTIRVMGYGMTVALIRTHDYASVWPTRAVLSPRWGWVTDSFGEGRTSGGPMLEKIPQRVGRLMGVADTVVSAAGGTGFINPGTLNVFGDRADDMVDNECDAVFTLGGFNDANADYSQASIEAAMTAFYDEVRSGLPRAPITFIVPTFAQGGQAVDARWTKNRDAALAVMTDSRDAHCHVIDAIAGTWHCGDGRQGSTSGAWLSGSGKTWSTTGIGNADLYVGGGGSPDAIHPSPAGTAFWGERIAACLAEMMPL